MNTRSGRVSRVRSSQACEPCRNLKARCLPSEQANTCQRCFHAKRDCRWREIQPRARRVRTSTSRMSAMEQKLDGLVALLTPQDDPVSTTMGLDIDIGPQFSSTGHPIQDDIQNQQSGSNHDAHPMLTPGSSTDRDIHHSSEHSRFRSPVLTQGPKASDSNPNNTLHIGSSQRNEPQNDVNPPQPIEDTSNQSPNYEQTEFLVDDFYADRLLNEFRAMAKVFPFVIIPSRVNAKILAEKSPMVYHAVIMTASWKDRSLQIALEQRFRRELATKTIVDAHKNLDILQSILIYIAWYHMYFAPQTQQMTQLLQLAVGMTVELGFNRAKKKILVDISGKPKNEPPPTPFEERAAHRAFLGCYFLSSAYCGMFSRASLFKYTPYMATCLQHLSEAREYPSDDIIVHMTKLSRIYDQIRETFQGDDAENLSMDNIRLQMHQQLLLSHLKEWKNNLFSENSNTALNLNYDFCTLELHSIGLRITTSQENSSQTNSDTLSNTNHVNLLLACLDSGKSYLDRLLEARAEDYTLFSMAEWMRLPMVIMTLAKLSIPSEDHACAGWDITAAQEKIRLDLCLESLCYRMGSLTTHNPPQQPNPDIFLSLKMILELTRQWYGRKTRPGSSRIGPDDNSPLERIQNPHGPPPNINFGAGNSRMFPHGPMASLPDGHPMKGLVSSHAAHFTSPEPEEPNLSSGFCEFPFGKISLYEPFLFPEFGSPGNAW